MRLDELKLRVRTKMDELGANDSDMMDIEKDNKELDTMIELSAVDALSYLLMRAPLGAIKGESLRNSQGEIDTTNMVCRVDLPTDFLRLKSVRLSSWKHAVSTLISDDSPIYLMQHDEYACGTPERPIAFVVDSSDGLKIELYKAESSTDLVDLRYIARPAITESILGDKSMEVPYLLEDALVYMVASLVLKSYKEFDLSEAMLKMALSLANIAE